MKGLLVRQHDSEAGRFENPDAKNFQLKVLLMSYDMIRVEIRLSQLLR